VTTVEQMAHQSIAVVTFFLADEQIETEANTKSLEEELAEFSPKTKFVRHVSPVRHLAAISLGAFCLNLNFKCFGKTGEC
jgi:hypothetical protein